MHRVLVTSRYGTEPVFCDNKPLIYVNISDSKSSMETCKASLMIENLIHHYQSQCDEVLHNPVVSSMHL